MINYPNSCQYASACVGEEVSFDTEKNHNRQIVALADWVGKVFPIPHREFMIKLLCRFLEGEGRHPHPTDLAYRRTPQE